jgi:hypothetical protein
LDHIRLMSDCVQACQVSRDFMLRKSPLHRHFCSACASVCTQCAADCDRLAAEAEWMKPCAEACKRCAESCKSMSASS